MYFKTKQECIVESSEHESQSNSVCAERRRRGDEKELDKAGRLCYTRRVFTLRPGYRPCFAAGAVSLVGEETAVCVWCV